MTQWLLTTLAERIVRRNAYRKSRRKHPVVAVQHTKPGFVNSASSKMNTRGADDVPTGTANVLTLYDRGTTPWRSYRRRSSRLCRKHRKKHERRSVRLELAPTIALSYIAFPLPVRVIVYGRDDP